MIELIDAQRTIHDACVAASKPNNGTDDETEANLKKIKIDE